MTGRWYQRFTYGSVPCKLSIISEQAIEATCDGGIVNFKLCISIECVARCMAGNYCNCLSIVSVLGVGCQDY